MKTRRPRHIAPQHEFPFAADTFTLFAENALDGERLARDRAEADQARRLAESAQIQLLTPTTAHE
jgi:hypothetical protein